MTNPSCRSYLSCNLLISSRYLLGILCGIVFSLTSGQSLTWRSSIELSFLLDNIIYVFIHISSFRGIWMAKQTYLKERVKIRHRRIKEEWMDLIPVVPPRSCPSRCVYANLAGDNRDVVKFFFITLGWRRSGLSSVIQRNKDFHCFLSYLSSTCIYH